MFLNQNNHVLFDTVCTSIQIYIAKISRNQLDGLINCDCSRLLGLMTIIISVGKPTMCFCKLLFFIKLIYSY